MKAQFCNHCGNEIVDFKSLGKELFNNNLRATFPSRRAVWVLVEEHDYATEVARGTSLPDILLRLKKAGRDLEDFLIGLWLEESEVVLWEEGLEAWPDLVVEPKMVVKGCSQQ